jgi:hypothetical protein
VLPVPSGAGDHAEEPEDVRDGADGGGWPDRVLAEVAREVDVGQADGGVE